MQYVAKINLYEIFLLVIVSYKNGIKVALLAWAIIW